MCGTEKGDIATRIHTAGAAPRPLSPTPFIGVPPFIDALVQFIDAWMQFMGAFVPSIDALVPSMDALVPSIDALGPSLGLHPCKDTLYAEKLSHRVYWRRCCF